MVKVVVFALLSALTVSAFFATVTFLLAEASLYLSSPSFMAVMVAVPAPALVKSPV